MEFHISKVSLVSGAPLGLRGDLCEVSGGRLSGRQVAAESQGSAGTAGTEPRGGGQGRGVRGLGVLSPTTRLYRWAWGPERDTNALKVTGGDTNALKVRGQGPQALYGQPPP